MNLNIVFSQMTGCWDQCLFIGGENYKPLPEGQEPLEADVSLVTNRIRSDLMLSDTGTGAELSVKEHYQVSLADSYSSGR